MPSLRFAFTATAVVAIAQYGCTGTQETERAPDLNLLGDIIGIIGEEETTQEALLWSPRSIAFRSSGDIVIADRDMQIKVFSADGRHRFTTGGMGAGPGEFRQLQWAYEGSGDSIAAFDSELARLSIFDPSGRFVRSYSANAAAGFRFVNWIGITNRSELIGFVLPVTRDSTSPGWGRTPLVSGVLEGDALHVDTIDTPVWLRCNPAAAVLCTPMPDASEQRRGEMAVAGRRIYALPAASTELQLYTVQASKWHRVTIPLPETTPGDRVRRLIGTGHDVWFGLDRTGPGEEWLVHRSDGTWHRYLVTNGTVVAVQHQCVLVRDGSHIRVQHISDQRADTPVPSCAEPPPRGV